RAAGDDQTKYQGDHQLDEADTALATGMRGIATHSRDLVIISCSWLPPTARESSHWIATMHSSSLQRIATHALSPRVALSEPGSAVAPIQSLRSFAARSPASGRPQAQDVTSYAALMLPML